MKIVKDYPPNIDTLREHFTIGKNVVFTWGDILYVPGDGEVQKHLMMHEETHERQQAAKGGPQPWWDEYLENIHFRLSQEIEAYGNQMRYIRSTGTKDWKTYLAKLAEDLAGPIYGYSISFAEAYQKILAASS